MAGYMDAPLDLYVVQYGTASKCPLLIKRGMNKGPGETERRGRALCM